MLSLSGFELYSRWVPLAFHSPGQHLCKFIGTKESFYLRKEFNPQRMFLLHQHGRYFIVLQHQYGHRNASCENALSSLTARRAKSD